MEYQVDRTIFTKKFGKIIFGELFYRNFRMFPDKKNLRRLLSSHTFFHIFYGCTIYQSWLLELVLLYFSPCKVDLFLIDSIYYPSAFVRRARIIRSEQAWFVRIVSSGRTHRRRKRTADVVERINLFPSTSVPTVSDWCLKSFREAKIREPRACRRAPGKNLYLRL